MTDTDGPAGHERPTPREAWDVVVVGAGPAGSAAALGALAEDPSLRVLLLDRGDFPRDKSCGDGIAPHVLDALATSAPTTSWTAGRRCATSSWPTATRASTGRWPGRSTSSRARSSTPGWSSAPSPPGPAAPAPGARRRRGTGTARRRSTTPSRPAWSSAPTAPTPSSAGAPRRAPGAARHRDPRLRPHHRRTLRGTPADPVRRPPPAVVRLGLRPRRRPRQRRLRRVAARRGRGPRAAQPGAAARAARAAAARRGVDGDGLAGPPPAARRPALGPAGRPGAAGRGRGRAGQPDDGGGHLLRGRDRHHRGPYRRPDPGRRAPAGRRRRPPARRTTAAGPAPAAHLAGLPADPVARPSSTPGSVPPLATGRVFDTLVELGLGDGLIDRHLAAGLLAGFARR